MNVNLETFPFANRLEIPLIVAPMFLVSSTKMTIAPCRSGVIGRYPAHTTRTKEVFEDWRFETEEALNEAEAAGEQPAPFAVNLVGHPSNARLEGDLEILLRHKVPIVLTSKGAPGWVPSAS